MTSPIGAAPLGWPPIADDRMATELPTDERQPWPPPRFNPVHADWRVWDAWWSGDPDRLMRAYYSIGSNSPIGRQYFATTGERGLSAVRPGQYRGGLLGSVRRFFWGVPTPPGEKRVNYHLPLPADMAATSASLLFAQPPQLTCDDSATQDYLNELIDDGMHAKLLEGGENAAAMGGVFYRAVWDTDIADSAWLDIVPPDAAVPEFRYDRLASVIFWSVIEDTGKTVVRHLEKHIPNEGVILHAVYEGDQQKIGRQVDLGGFPDTRHLQDVIELPDWQHKAPTVVYHPNIRPNRIWRDLGPWAAPLGRSDYTSLESDFDALDEAFSSLMRDIRLGKARLIVPQSYLDNIGRGKGAVFEPEREVYSPVAALVTGEASSGLMIEEQQFQIRAQEHLLIIDAIIEKIINFAGYSGQTLGLKGDIAVTATEVNARNQKSNTTRNKKILYARPPLRDIVLGIMAVNQAVYGSRVTPVRPDMEFPDTVMPDAEALAQTISVLRAAEVLSIETGVARANPDWDTDQVQAEVTRIMNEMGVDVLSRARAVIQGAPGETFEQQLAGIPQDLAGSDNPAQVAAVAAQSHDTGNG